MGDKRDFKQNTKKIPKCGPNNPFPQRGKNAPPKPLSVKKKMGWPLKGRNYTPNGSRVAFL